MFLRSMCDYVTNWKFLYVSYFSSAVFFAKDTKNENSTVLQCIVFLEQLTLHILSQNFTSTTVIF